MQLLLNDHTVCGIEGQMRHRQRYFPHIPSRLLTFVLIALGSFSVSTSVALAAEPLPKVVVRETEFNFGTVRQGVAVEHRFKVENAGSAPLKILKMHSSCGCAAAVLDSDTINAGGETSVKTTFDTTGFQGLKVKTVRLYTNDPKQASFVLTLKGVVQPDVVVSVPRVRFGDLTKGAAASQQLTVTVERSSPLQILEASTRSQYLELLTEETSFSGRRGKKITVKLKPETPLGLFRDRISIKTSSPENPVVSIPVMGNIQGDLQLEPPTLSFGLISRQSVNAGPVSRSVEVRSRTGAPVKILAVESDTEGVTGKVVRDGGKSLIRVTVNGDLSGALRSRLVIKTDSSDAEQRQIILPVFGIFSRTE